MRILIIAVGEKPPAWVKAGFAEYARRLPKPFTPQLIEVAPGERGKGRDPARAIASEGERVLAAIPDGARAIALDERGTSWSSVELSRRFEAWSRDGQDIALLIGGPDGHAPAVLARADQRWSLGPLVLPHMLVRLLLAEQLYRAWSITRNHPYHRA